MAGNDRARIAYEAWLISLGHKPAWHENDVRHQAAWQAVADALDTANEDTARLDWLLPVLSLAEGPTDTRAMKIGGALMLSMSGRAAIDAARKGE